MRLKQQRLDGRCPGTKGTHSCTCTPNLFTVTANSASRVIFKSRPRPTHLLADRKPRPLPDPENRNLNSMEEITEIKKEYSFLLK